MPNVLFYALNICGKEKKEFDVEADELIVTQLVRFCVGKRLPHFRFTRRYIVSEGGVGFYAGQATKKSMISDAAIVR